MASVALGNVGFSARDAAPVFLSVTGAPSAIQYGTGAGRDALVVDKMWYAGFKPPGDGAVVRKRLLLVERRELLLQVA